MKQKLPNRLATSVIIAIIVLGGAAFAFSKTAKHAKAPIKEINKDVQAGSSAPSSTPTPEPSRAAVSLSNLSMPVLMYHHIRVYNDDRDQIGVNLSVAPAEFAKQLDLIKEKGYTTVTFEDITDGNLPEKPIMITFDDGYQNFYDNGYPELKKRNMKAVSYVITDDIGKGEYMTLAEIKEINTNGIEIGSHTKSHPDLTTIPTEKAKSELADSKGTLENIIGKKIISFCYPSGKYNDSIIAQTKEAGYSFATTTKAGYAKFSSLFDLQRERVNADTNIAAYLK